MSEPLRKKSWAWLPIACLATLLLYPLSFGPTCWVASRMASVNGDWINQIYFPIIWTYDQSPDAAQKVIRTYANLGGGHFTVMFGGRSQIYFFTPSSDPFF